MCIPASSNINEIKSEAPLITFGCSTKSLVEFTNPVNLIHDLILDRSPLHAFLICAIILRAHLFAASYPAFVSKSFPTFPFIKFPFSSIDIA